MEQLISNFHVDIKMLLAQFVNFGITFLILYHFVIKPLMKLVDERSEKIAKGVKHANEMESRIQALEDEREEVLTEARTQAQAILAESKSIADKEYAEKLEKAKKDVKQLLENGKTEIESKRQQMFDELQKETVSLVHTVTLKVLKDVMGDKAVDKKYIEKQILKIGK